MNRHVKERLQERYNMELTNQDYNNIINLIQQNKSTPLSFETKNSCRKFHYVIYNNIPIKVLYRRSKSCGIKSKSPGKIITVYPIDVDEYNKLMENKQNKQVEKLVNKTNNNLFRPIINCILKLFENVKSK